MKLQRVHRQSAMGLVRKGSSVKRKGSSIATSTLSADANARQVTRAEFMELAAAVTQLKKDSLRQQAVGKFESLWAISAALCLGI
jgi:hypothetical protein